jgi:hypothetical protein
MILVNGISAGIGTGWSCSIPSYNIIELINILKQLLTITKEKLEFSSIQNVLLQCNIMVLVIELGKQCFTTSSLYYCLQINIALKIIIQ